MEAATHPDADIVVNAVVGAAGLDATLAALRAGKRVALANKETLVMAGDLVAQAACAGGGEIVPDRLGAQRRTPMRHRAGRRPGPPDPDGLRRAVPRMGRRAGLARHGGGGAAAPHLADGPQDHGGLRHPGQQGARADRGPLPVRAALRRAGGGGPSPEHRARLCRVLRRERAGPAGLPLAWSCRFSTP